MSAGKLRDRITIERQGDITDEFGNPETDEYGNTKAGWSPLMSLWADIRETTGKERVEAGRVEASRTSTIRIRRSSATAGITEADRIQARGVAWNIRSIAQVDRAGAMLEMLCEAGTAT